MIQWSWLLSVQYCIGKGTHTVLVADEGWDMDYSLHLYDYARTLRSRSQEKYCSLGITNSIRGQLLGAISDLDSRHQ